MQSIIPSIDLLRYRVFLRVNAAYVSVDATLPMRLSYALGQSILAQISLGREGRRWRSALSAWEEQGWPGVLQRKKADFPFWPAIRWPVETVLAVRPNKRFYGRGELLDFEIKLLGSKASHAFFLEYLLPALENLGYAASVPWRRPHGLLGHFDIAHVYVARGLEWEPVVQDGEVDLRLQPDTRQWASGWPFEPPAGVEARGIAWVSPYAPAETNARRIAPPSLADVLAACVERLAELSPQAAGEVESLWQQLEPAEQAALLEAVEQTRRIGVSQHTLKRVRSKGGRPPGLKGEQHFAAAIPSAAVPYLELGSILHIGAYTHFGYGTFRLLVRRVS